MKIIDTNNALPDKTKLLNILKNHPLSNRLEESIDNLSIIDINVLEKKKPTEAIDYNLKTKNADLFVFGTGSVQQTIKKPNFEYIMYHEFAHIADKLNPQFEYSEKKDDSLSKKEKEAVMSIWNAFIDSRLKAEKNSLLAT